MSADFFLGLFLGFMIAFLCLKLSINRSGYGELRMCKEKCPYYRSVELSGEEEEEGNDD